MSRIREKNGRRGSRSVGLGCTSSLLPVRMYNTCSAYKRQIPMASCYCGAIRMFLFLWFTPFHPNTMITQKVCRVSSSLTVYSLSSPANNAA